MISSPQNSKIKWVRKLVGNSRFRRAECVFVVEGVRMAEEVLTAGWLPSLVLFSDDLSKRGKQLVHNYRASSVVEEVSEAVMRSVSDTDTPQGILVVVEEQKLPLPQALDFVLIPDLVRDPGNMGAILRSAAAAGVQAVLIPPKTIDPFTPKVVRSAMGAHFRLPLLDPHLGRDRRFNNEKLVVRFAGISGKWSSLHSVGHAPPGCVIDRR